MTTRIVYGFRGICLGPLFAWADRKGEAKQSSSKLTVPCLILPDDLSSIYSMMEPKKGGKINLSDFLGDGALGSWADDIEQLPSARFAWDEVPLPTQPPYTAFIGNLGFDISEADIANHFSDFRINWVKIIKDTDDKPKGFGYVEFESLDGLKDALSKSGSNLAGRNIRVSVAEPLK
ncbi:hypothetical protein MD484_g9073, partial [Candolleomyces efflorescens]